MNDYIGLSTRYTELLLLHKLNMKMIFTLLWYYNGIIIRRTTCNVWNYGLLTLIVHGLENYSKHTNAL